MGGDIIGLTVLAIAAQLTQVLAVVGTDDDDRILVDALLFQLPEYLAQLLVRVPDAGVVLVHHGFEIVQVLDLGNLARRGRVGHVVVARHLAGTMAAGLCASVMIQ